MLTKLTIANFQKHRKKIIKLGRITTIIGGTDRGKSAIIRALQWLFFNEAPRSFLRKGSSKARVEIEIDGHTVSRRRGTSNVYQLDDHKFKAVGTKVPEDIAKLLNVDGINFQDQHGSVFWFSLSAGQVGKEMNRIVDLSVIDKVTSEIASTVRKAKWQLEATDSSLSETEAKVEELSWILRADKAYRKVEMLYSAAAEKHVLVEDLMLFLDKLERTQTAAKNARVLANQASGLMETAESELHVSQQIEGLHDLISEIESAKKDAARKIPNLRPLERLHRKAVKVTYRKNKLSRILEVAQTQKEKACQSESQQKQTERLLQRKLKGRCPVCSRKMVF